MMPNIEDQMNQNVEPEGAATGRLDSLPSPQLMNTTTTGTERQLPPLGGSDTLQQFLRHQLKRRQAMIGHGRYTVVAVLPTFASAHSR